MSRAPLNSVAFPSAALRRFSRVFLLAAVVADASSTHRYLRHQEAVHPKVVQQSSGHCVCASFLQENARQDPAATTQCPCLVTPAPAMSPEETQAAAIEAAANTATLAATQQIQAAGKEAADPIKEEIEKTDVATEVGGHAKEALKGIVNAAGAKIQEDIHALIASEMQDLQAMAATAKNIGALGADHLRKTAEDWGKNQVRNYVVEHASPVLKEAAEEAKKTEEIRQGAAQTVVTAIKASAESVEVAQGAQAAIALVPKDSFKIAQEKAKKSAKEQKKLKEEIAITESTVRKIAEVSQEAAIKAQRTLEEAQKARDMAKKALETSRSNAEKIELLKTRSQAAYEKSQKAKEAVDALA